LKQTLLRYVSALFLVSALILTSAFNTAPAPAAALTTYTFDGFEDGVFADTGGQPGAGYGWNDTGWTPSGTDAFILNSEGPIGSYHVRIQKPNTYISRTVDLGQFVSARLRFWYRTKSVTSNYGYVTLSAVGIAPWTYSFQGLSPQPTTHTEYVVDVPTQFVGKVVSLKFGEAGSQSRAYVYWDSISIESLDPLNTPTPPPVLDPHQVVNTYGRLQISAVALKDQNGNAIQLHGMDSHGLTWFPLSDLNLNNTSNINMMSQPISFAPTQGVPFPHPSSAVGNLVTQWHIQVVKATMFPYDPWNGSDAKSYDNNYPVWKWYNINLVNSIVQAAIDENIYVIIDWHAGEGNDPDPNVYWTNGHAQEFFTYMVDKWGSYPNVIYQTVNSPNNIAWKNAKSGKPGLKTYNQNIINLIRSREAANGYAPNLIIAGTPTYSQDVDIATNDPLTGNSIAYNFMWYAGTHGISIRSKAETALTNLASKAPNQTLFMSEVGTTASNGTGGVYYSEFNTWLEWAKTKKLSWLNWSISSKEEDSAIFVPAILGNVPNNEVAWRGGDGASIPEAFASTGYPMRIGPWADADYSCSGKFVRGWIMNNTTQPVPAGCP
jgi:aryl-phospho-beta-D-glucosidase BglC (GH1 family)